MTIWRNPPESGEMTMANKFTLESEVRMACLKCKEGFLGSKMSGSCGKDDTDESMTSTPVI